MANKFTESAKRTTSLSRVIAGREKLEMKELVKLYPDGVTINEFDIVNGSTNSYPVFAFAEDTEKYVNGGSGMIDTVETWASMYEGDVEGASIALKECGGVKIKFEYVKTQNGRDFCRPTVVDE
jgi:hypothetical protein